MAWAAIPKPQGWIAAGVFIILWSGLSVLAFHRSSSRPVAAAGRSRQGQRGGRAPARRRADAPEDVESKAEKNARRISYKNLASYLDEKGGQGIEAISSDLAIPKSRVSELRRGFYPRWVSFKGNLSPGAQLHIMNDMPTLSKSELQAKYNVSAKAIQSVLKRYEEARREESSPDTPPSREAGASGSDDD
jgi:hypothetical protein